MRFIKSLFLAVLTVTFAAAAASPGPYSIEFRVRNSTNTQWEPVYVSGIAGSKLMGISSLNQPVQINIGSGLAFDAPTNTLSATGGGGGGGGLYSNTIASLRALALTGISNGDLITVRGYYATNDGGQGTFVYDNSSTATDDGGLVIQPTVGRRPVAPTPHRRS